MSQANMLKEFLVGLGFKVDQQGNKEFQKATDDATESVEALGEATDRTEKRQDKADKAERDRAKRRKAESERERKEQQKREEQRKKDLQAFADGAMVVAAATAAAITKIAMEMDRTFMSAVRTKSTVSGLEQIGYAGKQLGIDLNGAVAALNQFLSSSPGAEDLLTRNGVAVRDQNGAPRDRVKVLQDLGSQMQKMDEAHALAFGRAVGLDFDAVQAFRRGDIQRLMKEQQDIARQIGVNLEDSAASVNLFMTNFRKATEEMKVAGEGLAGKLAPIFGKILGLPEYDRDKKGPEMVARLLAYLGNKTAQDALNANKALPDGFVPGEASPTGKASRGVRNNNPGNIVYGQFAKDMGATGSDGRFAVFPDAQTGLAAMAENLRQYSARGLDTMDKIIRRWAPPSENDTTGYINRAAGMAGVRPGQKLDFNNPAVLSAVMGAITRVENGYNPYSLDMQRTAAGVSNTTNNGGSVSIQQTNYNSFDGASPTLAGDVAQASLGPMEAIVRNSLARTR